jgi:hypothetical protein
MCASHCGASSCQGCGTVLHSVTYQRYHDSGVPQQTPCKDAYAVFEHLSLLMLHVCVSQVLDAVKQLCCLYSSGLYIASPTAHDLVLLRNESLTAKSESLTALQIVLGSVWGLQPIPHVDSLHSSTPCFMAEELPGNVHQPLTVTSTAPTVNPCTGLCVGSAPTVSLLCGWH